MKSYAGCLLAARFLNVLKRGGRESAGAGSRRRLFPAAPRICRILKQGGLP